MTPEDVTTFERCIAVGGVALFPAPTPSTGSPPSPTRARAWSASTGSRGGGPTSRRRVMFFELELALAALPELPARTRGALERLLPGGVTLLLPNPARRFPLACGPVPQTLGLRVPRLEGELAPLAAMRWPVLQSSANRAGEADARRLEDVDERVRAGVDLVLDAGELPGTASTVVDLTGYHEDGRFAIVREGALPAESVREALVRSSR